MEFQYLNARLVDELLCLFDGSGYLDVGATAGIEAILFGVAERPELNVFV